MKSLINIFTAIIFLFLLSYPLKAEEFTYLTTSLSKSFKSAEYPYKVVETKITIKTRLNDDDLTESSILRTRNIHNKYLEAFNAKSWKKINESANYLDIGYIEVTQEDRMNLKLKKNWF